MNVTDTKKPPNRLINETSPYLLQHANNPVDWYPWGPEALQTAKELNKPIFLSIGYSSCHWCHVMERESFENQETARIMNELFVNIKVDREERPDIDEIYMQAAHILTGSGGWPLSVFLQPDLKPFYAGTYFPPVDAYNRPGFPRILTSLATAYTERSSEVAASAAEVTDAIDKTLKHFAVPGQITWGTLDVAVSELMGKFDRVYGGFGDAPKFPASMALQLLLREAGRRDDATLIEPVVKTLDEMQRGGVFDHIGGGFSRYSTDRQWLVPHFEKMLYDNALLLTVLVEAYQATGRNDFADTARRTADFILREMTDEQGGFYSALDADSEGEEGKYYVWSPSEIVEALGVEDGDLFCRVYGVIRSGNFGHGKSILHLSQNISDWSLLNDCDPGELAARLAVMREKLLAVRQERVRPALDDKVIVSWNGLTISALACAGRALDAPLYTDAAANAAEFLWESCGGSNELTHTWRQGQSRGVAFQEDYACFINGLVDLYQADYELKWLDVAQQLADTMISLFWDGREGGFFVARDAHQTPLARSKSPTDSVTPSGNSQSALGLARLSRLTGRTDLWHVANNTVNALAGMAAQAPRAFDNLLIAASFLMSEPREIVVAGNRDSEELRKAERILRSDFVPNTVFAWASPDNELAIAQGKASLDGSFAAYICENYACHSPIHSADELRLALDGEGNAPD
ncbi:MAG: thioredoxin domain-containing protein [Armatimonadota bacterium]